MGYDAQLDFVRRLLGNLRVGSCIVSEPSRGIPCGIDMGLRRRIFDLQDYSRILRNSMSEAAHNKIYRFFDEYFCGYIFLRLPEQGTESFFFIGPFLDAPPEEERILAKLEALGLDRERGREICRLYSEFPVIEDENLLMSIAVTLGESLWGTAEDFDVEYIEYTVTDNSFPVSLTPAAGDYAAPAFSLAELEANYANEKALMDAVSQGMLQKLNVMAASVYSRGTESRLSDSLRNRKNYLIILNTLLRKAAEQGGVHPVHIDRISSRFAREIEKILSIKSSLRLQETMIRDYCLLVRRHSLKNRSYLIGRAITLIHFDLQADLRLKSLAAQLGVSPGYLSGRFSRECGCTVTEYVNRRRVEKAMELLASREKQVQDIAYECGIADSNYFIRLFKKYTGLSPTQYRSGHEAPRRTGEEPRQES